MPRECTVIAITLFWQHKRRPYAWTSLDGQHQNQTDYILCNRGWGNSIQSAKIRLGADCGSDHEFLIEKFRLKLKTIWKSTRPFRYDLNQIPYDYIVEVTNRYNALDLMDTVPEELWMEVHNTVQEAVIKTIPQRKKCKKGKMVVWGSLTKSWEKKRHERQRRKGNIYPSECRVPKNSKER